MKYKIYHISFLLFTFIVLISSVFAWFTVGEKTGTEFLELKVGKRSVDAYLYVSKNVEDDGDYIIDEDQMIEILEDGIPTDYYTFTIKLINHTGKDVELALRLLGIYYQSQVPGMNILDIYTIKNGLVMFGDEAIYLTPNSLDEQYQPGYENTPEGLLSVYRISNLINEDNNLVLFENMIMAERELEVVFTIEIDPNIMNSDYIGKFIISRMEIEGAD